MGGAAFDLGGSAGLLLAGQWAAFGWSMGHFLAEWGGHCEPPSDVMKKQNWHFGGSAGLRESAFEVLSRDIREKINLACRRRGGSLLH